MLAENLVSVNECHAPIHKGNTADTIIVPSPWIISDLYTTISTLAMTSNLHALISDYSFWVPAPIWKIVPPFAFLWATQQINRYLNSRALNNGVQAIFDWKKEIVLVTGGSDGIGAATVLKLAERGTAVIVLDIRPLKYDARKDPLNLRIFKFEICLLTS